MRPMQIGNHRIGLKTQKKEKQMSYIPVAVEMYSVRKEFAANPLATMKALKEMGYEGVEFAGAPQFSGEFYGILLSSSASKDDSY